MAARFAQHSHPPATRAGALHAGGMKAKVFVRLKPEVLDPQGDAVGRALSNLGAKGVRSVRIGKLIELEVDDGPHDDVRRALDDLARKLLANEVIEDYEIEIQGEPSRK